MKWLKIKDEEWHDVNKELPSTTTDVEFITHNNSIVEGHIFVDMSGAYAAIPNEVGYTWSSFDYYKAWRFRQL